jgi:hypothetical protein
MWKPVPGYEDRYLVSDEGEVFSLFYEKMLKQANKRGYMQVALSRDNHMQYVGVHRLVAMAFLDPDAERIFVNHKDGNKHNNRVENLEWCTPSENTRHSIDVLGQRKRAVYQKDKDGNVLGEYPSIKEAAEAVGAKAEHVWRCVKGIRKKTCGFYWEYVNPDERERSS